MRSTRKSSALALIPKIFIASLILLVGILPPSLHAQGNWPMPGHDAQRTGRANFAGPTTAPSSPSWSFPTAAPIVGDITTSAEGNLYFASDRLYALKPDGTALVPPAPIAAPVTGPAVDDNAGLVYIVVSSADGGFDLLSFTKQLQGGTVLVHVPRPPFGGAVSPLLVGDGNVYFVAGRFPGVVYAAGATPWSYPYCTGEAGASTPFGVSANAPALSADGASLFVICSGSLPEGFFRLNPFTGAKITSTTSQTNSTEPVIDSFQHIRSGWQAFGGGAFCGDFLSWDASLALVTPPASVCDSSRFTTSRAVILPDGFSTARIGFAFPPNNQLDATGANTWTITTDNSTIPNFTSVPAVDAAGNIFIGNSQGIQARSSVDGHTLWSFTTGNAITTQPVIANGGALYAGSSSGVVYAFNTQSKNAAGTVYVSSGAVVDLSTASIAARFPGTTGVLRVSPDGSRIYESSTFGMDVIDSATNKVITTVPVGSQPLWIDISPDGSRIYVSQPNIPSAPGVLQGVYVVDAATNAIIASIGIPGPERVAVAPDNSRVYVGSQGRGIAIIDPATDTVTGSISILGANLTGIAFTPDSARAYVGEASGPFLYQIDARANSLINTVTVTGALGGGVGAVIASPDGSKIYAGNDRSSPFDPAHNVFVLNTATNTVTAQIPVSFPSEEMALSTDGANLLLGDSDVGNLLAVSVANDSVIESLPVTDPCCHGISGISAKPPIATGTVSVSTNVAAAHFSLVGPITITGVGSLPPSSAPVGVYAIRFESVVGFVTPEPQTATLIAGGNIRFIGTYVPDTGNIIISTNLERATFDLQGPNDIRGPISLHGSGFSMSFLGVPSGQYQIKFGGQPLCYAGTPATQVHTLAAGQTLHVNVSYEVGFLSFPLSASDPCTHPIASVFDHSQTRPYSLQKEVTAYTGETGACLDSTTDCESHVPGSPHFGFLRTDETSLPFTVNGNYTGGSGTCKALSLDGKTNVEVPCTAVLFYNGHPGYDYRAICGTPVLSVGSGTVHYPRSFPGISDGKKYHVLELDLDAPAGYKIYYLHLGSYPANQKNGSCESPATVPDGVHVDAGIPIGLSGSEGTLNPHLHFEIQYNGIPVDPYGWKGTFADPYLRSVNVNLWK